MESPAGLFEKEPENRPNLNEQDSGSRKSGRIMLMSRNPVEKVQPDYSNEPESSKKSPA